MNKVNLLLSLMLTVVANQSWAVEDDAIPQETTSNSVIFDKATATRKADQFEVRLGTQDIPAFQNASVEYMNETIQIDLSGASFPRGKLLLKADDPTIKSVYIYEPAERSVRIRVILNKGIAARSFDGSVAVVKEDGATLIRLKGNGKKMAHKKNEAEIARTIAVTDSQEDNVEAVATAAAQPSAEAAPKFTVDSTDTPETSTPVQAKASTSRSAEGEQSILLGKTQPPTAVRESDIPITSPEVKNKKPEGDPVRRALFGAFALALFLGSALYGIKRWGGKPKLGKQTPKIQVVGQHYLGPKKSLMIVHIAGESLLLGVTDNKISLIKTLSLIDDEVPENIPKNFMGAMQEMDEPDSFAMGGLNEIRDMVSTRLRKSGPRKPL